MSLSLSGVRRMGVPLDTRRYQTQADFTAVGLAVKDRHETSTQGCSRGGELSRMNNFLTRKQDLPGIKFLQYNYCA